MKKLIKYSDTEVMEFDLKTRKGVIVNVQSTQDEIVSINAEISELKDVYLDDKKLLEWAKTEFPEFANYDQLKLRKERLIEKRDKMLDVLNAAEVVDNDNVLRP